jgi:hypothetical protein
MQPFKTTKVRYSGELRVGGDPSELLSSPEELRVLLAPSIPTSIGHLAALLLMCDNVITWLGTPLWELLALIIKILLAIVHGRAGRLDNLCLPSRPTSNESIVTFITYSAKAQSVDRWNHLAVGSLG